MDDLGYIAFLILVINFIVSYKGFKSNAFFENFKFEVDAILIQKDYKRLISSAFLHVSWTHLIFNMLSLYAFSGILEFELGGLYFAGIYFISLLGGDFLALLFHRNEGDYSSVGASGAVCGVIFASIALFPGMGVGFFGIPISIPGWLYGILYVAYTVYGIRSNRGNIGHEAHLGGALLGMLAAVLIRPEVLFVNYLPILAITLPSLIFIYLMLQKPELFLRKNPLKKAEPVYTTIDQKYNEEKVNKQRELDKILDKISRKGIDSLSSKEKQKLEDLSK